MSVYVQVLRMCTEGVSVIGRSMEALTIVMSSYLGIATGYRLDGWGSIPGKVRYLSASHLPYRLWGLPNVLSNGSQGIVPPAIKRSERHVDP
jgi:hypothetical protein